MFCMETETVPLADSFGNSVYTETYEKDSRVRVKAAENLRLWPLTYKGWYLPKQSVEV